MNQKPVSPRSDKKRLPQERQREREARQRGEDDTAKKVMPIKKESSANRNAIRDERIKTKPSRGENFAAQDVSVTNSHQERGSYY